MSMPIDEFQFTSPFQYAIIELTMDDLYKQFQFTSPFQYAIINPPTNRATARFVGFFVLEKSPKVRPVSTLVLIFFLKS